MDQEELLLVVKRSFEKVKSDIKTHDAYIQALRAENELLKIQLQRLNERIEHRGENIVQAHNKVSAKQKILEYLSSGSRQLAELKEILVDRDKYCSKASFYRYIEDLRLRGELILVETDGIAFVSVSVRATN